MGTGPLALDDCLSPSLGGLAAGYFRYGKETYLSRVASTYAARPTDGRGDFVLSCIELTGTFTYNGTTNLFALSSASSDTPGYFNASRTYGGDPAIGPGGSVASFPGCPLVPDPAHPDGDDIPEAADYFVSASIALTMAMGLVNPRIEGTDWHDADYIWVPYSFVLNVSETTQYICAGGSDPGGGSSRDLDTNIIGIGLASEPPEGAVDFIGFGDGFIGLWLKDKDFDSEGLRLSGGGFV